MENLEEVRQRSWRKSLIVKKSGILGKRKGQTRKNQKWIRGNERNLERAKLFVGYLERVDEKLVRQIERREKEDVGWDGKGWEEKLMLLDKIYQYTTATPSPPPRTPLQLIYKHNPPLGHIPLI